MAKYTQADRWIWTQEEPRNMGAWSYLLMHYPGVSQWTLAAQDMYASPAAGSPVRAKKRHQDVIDQVFSL